MPFKVVPHTADLALKVWGNDLKELVESAIMGYVSLLTSSENVDQIETKKFTIDFSTPENLIVRILNKMIYLFDSQSFIPNKVEVEIFKNTVSCKVHGEFFDERKHLIKHCIKAATYCELNVVLDEDCLSARIILDD